MKMLVLTPVSEIPSLVEKLYAESLVGSVLPMAGQVELMIFKVPSSLNPPRIL